LPDPFKAIKPQMHTGGADIKAAPSVRPTVDMYPLKTSEFFSKDDISLDPINCIISNK
jgi:hypothetical protein